MDCGIVACFEGSSEPLYMRISNYTANSMPRKKTEKKKHKKVGIEAVVEPGVGALYTRGTWMKKLSELSKRKRKLRQMGKS